MRHSDVQHALQHIQVGLVEGLTLEANFVAIHGRNQRPLLVHGALLAHTEQRATQDGVRHAAHLVRPQFELQLAIWRSGLLLGLGHLAGSGLVELRDLLLDPGHRYSSRRLPTRTTKTRSAPSSMLAITR